MELDVVVPQKLKVKSVEVHVKVRDSGNYTLLTAEGVKVAELSEEYVPSFFPGDHYGDYLILNIDLETGTILNWKKPSPQEVTQAFGISPKKD